MTYLRRLWAWLRARYNLDEMTARERRRLQPYTVRESLYWHRSWTHGE